MRFIALIGLCSRMFLSAAHAADEPAQLSTEVHGTVRSTDGQRLLSGVEIVLVDQDGSNSARAVSKEDGTFDLHAKAGRYTLVIGGVLSTPVNVSAEGGASSAVMVKSPK